MLVSIRLRMVAAPLILGGGPKNSDQINWGGPQQKINLGGGGAKFKGGPKILGGDYEPQ